MVPEDFGIVNIPATVPITKLKELYNLTQEQVDATLKFITEKYGELKKDKETEVPCSIITRYRSLRRSKSLIR